MHLTTRIFIGMAVGLAVGALINVLFPALDSLVQVYLVGGIFDLGGQVFINLLRLMVVPLVFVSIVCGVSNLSDSAAIGRLGGKAVGLYMLTTAVAITLALIAAVLVQPGAGVTLDADVGFDAREAPAFKQVLLDIFPSNPIASMAEGNMLQIIFVAILVGLAMTRAGDAGARLKQTFENLNEVIMHMVMMLIWFAPYGVFCLMAELFATLGLSEIGRLLSYFFTVAGVLVLHLLVTYPVMLMVLGRLDVRQFFRQMREPMMVAFSTSSSSATLPVTLRTVQQNLGVSREVASFSIPLGATINMDGTAIMQGVATVFIAQTYGVDMAMSDYVMVIATATLASIGTAGVPGVGLIMLTMVLAQVNLPVEGIGLIIGIDRLLDMMRTAVNIAGDATVACVVARSEGKLDQSVFDAPAVESGAG